MIANEFLTMMEQDIATHKDREQLSAVLEVMREVLNGSSADIDEKKTVDECFKHMRNYAKKKQTNGCYYMDNTESRKVVAEYLGVPYGEPATTGAVSIEDFI